jgi:lipoprotein-releasing system permease protein
MLIGLFARRYLFSKKSHSVINLIAGVSIVSVAVPVAAMIVLLSVFNGFEQLVRSMNSCFDADLTILPTEGQTFQIEQLDTAALRRLPGVAALSLQLEDDAMLEYRGRQAIVKVRGTENSITQVLPLEQTLVAGDFAVSHGDIDRLVIGRGIASTLGMYALGETEAKLYAMRRSNFSTLLPMEAYTHRQADIVGVFGSDAEMDGKLVFTSLRFAQELFNHPHRATSIVVKSDGSTSLSSLRTLLHSVCGEAFDVKTRDELNASLYLIMQYEKWGVFLISFLVMFIASFSIVGAVIMLVLDKRPNFLTLRAMGADTPFIRRIFLGEGLLIGCLGAIIGTLLGVGLCLLQQHFGLIEIPADSFLVKSYPVQVQCTDVLSVELLFFFVVWIITYTTVQRTIK